MHNCSMQNNMVVVYKERRSSRHGVYQKDETLEGGALLWRIRVRENSDQEQGSHPGRGGEVPARFGTYTVRGRSSMFRSDHGTYAYDNDKCPWHSGTLSGIGRESTKFNANSALRKNYLNNYMPMRRR